MSSELRKARAVLSGGVTALGEGSGQPAPTNPEPVRRDWFRVDADYGGGWVLVGETYDRIGYLALADRAIKDGAKNVRIYRCEYVP